MNAMDGLRKHTLPTRWCAMEFRKPGGWDERAVRAMVRELIPCPKAFAAETGLSYATLMQVTGPTHTRALSFRVVHLAQERAGRWPIYELLCAKAGLPVGSVPLTVAAGADPALLLMQAMAELGDVSRAMEAAADPDSPGGAAYTDEELEFLRGQAAELSGKSTALVVALEARLRASRERGAA